MTVPATRHLSEVQLYAALERGAFVEQLLEEPWTGDGMVAWLSLGHGGEGYRLRRHRVQDIGSDVFHDVTDFPPVDEDEEHGEGVVVAESPEIGHALTLSLEHGADPGHWVNQGVVQDEYADRQSTRGAG
jgi:hypothetical protein